MIELEKNILFQIKLTKNVMENEHNKYLKSYNISAEQGLMLKFVYDNPGLTQTQISENLHKDKTTITRMIDTLVKKGKLQRDSFKEDRRVFRIYVTEETKNNVIELMPLFDKQENELMNIIDKDDYEITLEVLQKIKDYYKGLNK